MPTNLNSIRPILAESLDHSFALLSAQIPDSKAQYILQNFEVDSVSLESDQKAIHGRTLWEKAIDQADEIKIVMIRREKASDSNSETASPTEPKQIVETPNHISGQDSSASQIYSELLQALQNASAGRRFVALKWFRDAWLPQQEFDWVADPEKVRSVIRSAIDAGVLRKEQLANPNNPEHPTTTLKPGMLNQPRVTVPPHEEGKRRFTPMSISGKPLSATILEGR
jgi:hypothetical protein